MPSDARLFEVLADDVARLDATTAADLARPVPACPGWTVADLVGHVGQIHWRLVRLLAEGAPFRRLADEPPPPPPDEVLAWRAEGSARMLEVLGDADLDAPVTTFVGEVPARFWLRRMTNELAVHRWDLGDALGNPAPVPADVAVDCVDEVLDVFVPMLPVEAWAPVAGDGEATLHLHATDVEGEWFVRVSAAGVTTTHEHAKGDVAARGPASDLALVVWARAEPSSLDCFGDLAVLARFLEVASF